MNSGGRYLVAMAVRTLVPSWRFFQVPGNVARLSFRRQAAGGEWNVWEDAIPPCPRNFGTLFFNAEGNFRLAARGLVDRAVAEIADGDGNAEAFAATVTYRVLTQLVRYRIGVAGPGRFQFKIFADDGEALRSETFNL